MTLSFNKLNEIAELYESIAASEQEQLDEGNPYANTPDSQLTSNELNKKRDPNYAARIAQDNQRTKNIDARGGVLGQVGRKFTRMFGNGSDIKKINDADAADKKREQSAFENAKTAKTPTPTPTPTPTRTTTPTPTPTRTTTPTPRASSGPAAKVTPTKPAGSAMDQWAKANPKLAAAKAERDRTRGTSATTNPLMKDMKSSLPAPAPKSAPPSSTLKSATDAASKPAAFKPATINAASSTSASASGDTYKYKPNPSLMKKESYDAYDLVLEYLLSQGHAETVAEAQYLMTEMDAEMIGDIVEGIADRTANAVGHQRAGTLGDDDEMRKNQDATSASIGKMKRGSGAKVTPTLPGV
jgi:hypothetical protein